MRFGRAIKDKDGSYKVCRPGFYTMWPFIEEIRQVHVLQTPMALKPQEVVLADNLIFRFDGMVIYQISDVYKALFVIDDIEKSVKTLAMAAIRDHMATLTYDKLHDTKELQARLLEIVKSRGEEWGLNFCDFRLTDCSPVADTAVLINMKIGVQMKMKAIKEVFMSGEFIDSPGFAHSLRENSQLAAALIGMPVAVTLEEKTSE